MKQWLILISTDMWQYHKSTFFVYPPEVRISMWKIKVSSVLSLVVNGEIYKDSNKLRRDFFFSNFKSRNGSSMIFFRIHMDPLDHWRVKPHTTCLNFLSILTKQCTILNTTHWYLNIPLDQTHPFLKGFYYKLVCTYPQNRSMAGHDEYFIVCLLMLSMLLLLLLLIWWAG